MHYPPVIGNGLYNAFEGKIYYQFINASCHPVEGGYDTETFEVLDYGFVRDKDKGFYKGQAVEVRSSGMIYPQVKTDGATFVALADGYARDKNHVYFFNESNFYRIVIDGADPSTFKTITAWFGKDSHAGYYGWSAIPQSDGKTFEVVDTKSAGQYTLTGFTKDAVHVFLNDKMIAGADPKTFELIDEGSVSAKDKNSVYQCGQVVMPNQTGFKFLGDYYGRAGSNVYYLGQVIPGADASSFSPLGGSEILSCESTSGGYAKDKNHVYFSGKRIPGADPQTFKFSFELGIAQDENGEYRLGVKAPNDFIKCSTNTADLPGGLTGWQSRLPALGSDTSATAAFEFCTMPNQDKLIGYKPDPTVEAKTISWFDPKNQLIETMKLDCSNLGTVLPQSIRALNGSIVTLQCLAQDACASRVFYELNLDDWKSSSSSTLRKTDESYDCGYRG